MNGIRTTLMLLLLPVLAACSQPQEGRTWTLYDTKSEYRSTMLQLNMERDEAKNGREIFQKDGCIELIPIVSVVDNVELWRVYEVEDWKINSVGLRTAKRFYVTDPPGQPYESATNAARPEEMPPALRLPTGLHAEKLSLATRPVKVRWQITPAEVSGWINDPADGRVVLSEDWVANEQALERRRIFLCEDKLKKLLDTPSREFIVRIKLSSDNWKSSDRAAPDKEYFLREKITRELIEETLSSAVRKTTPTIGNGS